MLNHTTAPPGLRRSASQPIPTDRHHRRTPTFPLTQQSRRKPRRWPLVLRFVKGAIHGAILLPVLLHSLFTALVVYTNHHLRGHLGLPGSIVPSLSIVVGLMLVFRNSTSYDRFWQGRNCLTTCLTSVRNLTRVFLTNSGRRIGSPVPSKASLSELPSEEAREKALDKISAERADTEAIIRILLAVLYAIKHNLRAEWQHPVPISTMMPTSITTLPARLTPLASSVRPSLSSLTIYSPEYTALLPPALTSREDAGLSLPLQLSVLVEAYIRRGVDRGWFNHPLASQLSVQTNTLIDAFGRMETIRTTPVPVAHLIHARQVLALYTCILPFSLVTETGWLAVPIVAVVAFTLYGIEEIGSQLEDPFGYDKNDIKMDHIVEDARVEVMVLLEEWKREAMLDQSGERGWRMFS
ncbi:hypothetical protein H2201_007772 [Coniosporium apollinis]|uniref:Uncharacterized protein n=1 Tax=Coniosporium apollinis TaxID=61459 RepID=A0ABQ9NQ06_9PEZI|nr:hypothetical protein H2201_007772 [Coniosporium apollinis]